MITNETATWRKSSRCDSATCVETAHHPHDRAVAVRDSKDPTGPILIFTEAEWSAFLAAVKHGDYDL